MRGPRPWPRACTATARRSSPCVPWPQGSLAVELGAPAALVNPRLARFWALNAYAMHWGIFAVMRIKFRYQLSGIAFAAFAAERSR